MAPPVATRSSDTGRNDAPRFLLHVGLGRAGSSWIQASLRLSTAALRDAGVVYPLRGENPTDGTTTSSGNGRGVLRSTRGLRRLLDRHTVAGCDLLVSSERLSAEFADYRNPSEIVRVARRAGFDSVGLLLFVRDPVDHASSIWRHRVRSGKSTMTLGEHVRHRYRDPTLVRAILEQVDGTPGMTIDVHNYSVIGERLLECVEGFLSVPPSTLTQPPVTRVNRSLSEAELELQLALMRVFGVDASIVGSRLCERLPDQQPLRFPPPIADQQAMLERLASDLRWVNGRLPVPSRLRIDVSPPGEPPVDGLSPAQLAVIAEALGELARRRTPVGRINSMASRLRRRAGRARRALPARYARLLERG